MPRSIRILIHFVNNSPQVHAVDIVDSSKVLPQFGDAQMAVMWPPHNTVAANENDNSVVLALTLGQVTFVLTGDSEVSGVWSTLSSSLLSTTRFFKVPHHGAVNGTFDGYGNTPWLSALPSGAHVAISCHKEPHQHPNATVVNALGAKCRRSFGPIFISTSCSKQTAPTWTCNSVTFEPAPPVRTFFRARSGYARITRRSRRR